MTILQTRSLIRLLLRSLLHISLLLLLLHPRLQRSYPRISTSPTCPLRRLRPLPYRLLVRPAVRLHPSMRPTRCLKHCVGICCLRRIRRRSLLVLYVLFFRFVFTRLRFNAYLPCFSVLIRFTICNFLFSTANFYSTALFYSISLSN
jgi:hypothetical protein